MKKFIFIAIYAGLVILTGGARAESCPDLFLDHLHNYISEKIPQVSWLDLNPVTLPHVCRFIIRYYPFNRYVQEKIDDFLPLGIKSIDSNCSLISKGYHHAQEGYGVLENI